jgi:hypothetical protein
MTRATGVRDEAQMINDLTMLVRRLVAILRKTDSKSDVPQQAIDFLERNKLVSSPLRDDAPSPSPEAATPSADDVAQAVAGAKPSDGSLVVMRQAWTLGENDYRAWDDDTKSLSDFRQCRAALALDRAIDSARQAGERAGRERVFTVPDGWRIYRLWNNSLAAELDASWMVEIQRGTQNIYMRNVDGDVGHATPIEAIEAACERIRRLAPDTENQQ